MPEREQDIEKAKALLAEAGYPDGFSEVMPFSLWYRFARAARIADGPDVGHDVVVARDFLRGALTTLV